MTNETNPCRTYIVWSDDTRTSIEDYAKAVADGKPTPCACAEADKATGRSGIELRLSGGAVGFAQAERLKDAIDKAMAQQDELTAKREAAAKLYDAFINPHPFHSRDWHMVEAKRRGDAMRRAMGWHGGGFVGNGPAVNVKDEAEKPLDVNSARKAVMDGATVKDNLAKVEAMRIPVETRSVTAAARGLTPEQGNKGEEVIHGLVAYHFEGGKVIELDNVTRVVMSGTWMRVWSDVGLTIIDVSKLLHSTSYFKDTKKFDGTILEKSRKVHFSNGKQLNLRNVTEINVLNPEFWVIRHDEGVSNVYTAKVDAVTVGV